MASELGLLVRTRTKMPRPAAMKGAMVSGPMYPETVTACAPQRCAAAA